VRSVLAICVGRFTAVGQARVVIGWRPSGTGARSIRIGRGLLSRGAACRAAGHSARSTVATGRRAPARAGRRVSIATAATVPATTAIIHHTGSEVLGAPPAALAATRYTSVPAGRLRIPRDQRRDQLRDGESGADLPGCGAEGAGKRRGPLGVEHGGLRNEDRVDRGQHDQDRVIARTTPLTLCSSGFPSPGWLTMTSALPPPP